VVRSAVNTPLAAVVVVSVNDATCEFPSHILTVRGMVVSAFRALKVAEFITPFADDEIWMAYSTAVDWANWRRSNKFFPVNMFFFGWTSRITKVLRQYLDDPHFYLMKLAGAK